LFTELHHHLQSVTTHHLKTQNPSLTLLTDSSSPSKCGLIIVQQRTIDWINYNHKQIVSAIAYIMHKSSNMYEIIATVLNWCIWYE
jgi:hypothetical protein